MGLSESDISEVASAVKKLLQSDENKKYLHGLLFDFYSDFVSADGNVPGIQRTVITDFLLRERTNQIKTLNREKNPTEEDIKRKQELQSEIQGIHELKRLQEDTYAVVHKATRTKALIPDLIVETIEQKATVVLAYYYHWLVEHESTERELQQLHEEWPKSNPSLPPPDVKEIPVPVAIGFQFFVDECSEVKNIKIDGHKRVEKWVNEVTESCPDATLGRGRPGPKTDTKDLASDQQIYDEYQERRVKEGRRFTQAEFAKEHKMSLKDFKRLLKRVDERYRADAKRY